MGTSLTLPGETSNNSPPRCLVLTSYLGPRPHLYLVNYPISPETQRIDEEQNMCVGVCAWYSCVLVGTFVPEKY